MRILYLPNSYSQQRQREKKANIYPVRMAMEAEWYRNLWGTEVAWGVMPEDWYGEPVTIIKEPEDLDFLTLPRPDRVFTRAKEYTSGNYKYLPGTHIMSASGCWWGKCSFCVESKDNLLINTLDEFCTCPEYQYIGNSELAFKLMPDGKWRSQGLVGCSNQKNPFQPVCYKCLKIRKEPTYKNNYEVRPVEDVISEIEECKSLGFKEVFDDSATFPQGAWLDEFCRQLGKLSNGRGEKIVFSCNSRICRLVDYNLLKRSGFRMLLFGIESANQETLDKINKGVQVEDIIPTIKKASEAGLEPHIAVMFGYPWESDKDAERTLNLVHYLLRKGYAKTAQASLYCPPNGIRNEAHKKFVKKIYNVGFSPEFWLNRLRSIKDVSDIKYIWRGIKAWYQS